MSRYIDADKFEDELYEHEFSNWCDKDEVSELIDNMPTADVVEVGIITCFGIKFVMEDDIIKVKWRRGDKHYSVPFGGLLALWEMYKKEQEMDGEEHKNG